MQEIKLVLSTTVAAALTYLLNINLGLGPFIASGLVGLIAAKIFPKFSAGIYAASFASMSSIRVLPNVYLSSVAGFFTGLLYIFTQKIFIGVGGKLGAIAFFSVLGISLFTSSLYFSQYSLSYLEGASFIFGSCLGALPTYILSHRFRQNPVFSSSLIVLTTALIFKYLLRFDDNFVAAVTCGSYAGMSSQGIMGNYKKMLLVGLVCGLILFLSWPFFCGVGGRLGLVAFLAVFLSRLGRHKSAALDYTD